MVLTAAELHHMQLRATLYVMNNCEFVSKHVPILKRESEFPIVTHNLWGNRIATLYDSPVHSVVAY